MALTTNKKELNAIDIDNYEQVRPQLKTGDLVFCSGNYIFSKVIQRLTKSCWSHVGVIYIDEELKRVLILESETLIGVRLIPLSKYLKDYKDNERPYEGNLIIARVNPNPSKELVNRGISYGLDSLAQPYDNREIFRILTRILFKLGKRERNKRFVCSELVRDVYKEAKVFFKYTNNFISPESIWQDDRVNKIYRLL